MNANHDLIPAEYIPYPKRAPMITHDLREIERIATTQNQTKNQNKTMKRNRI
jgi:hypothetical protein